MFRLILAGIGLVFTLQSKADFPTNTYDIPEGALSGLSGVSKASFSDAIKEVQKVYAPILKSQVGCDLNIINNWPSGTVNAYADRLGNECRVEMMGGFGRFSGMTKGAVVAVLCHEVGHHMGGDPKYSRHWASCEGQSDYFAQSCLSKLGYDAYAAGDVLGKVLAVLGEESKPSYSTPDTRKANGIYCSHPRAQCRMDTYLAGMTSKARPQCWYNP